MLDPEYFMQEALKEARAAYDNNEVPIGAIITCQDIIIARANNQVEKLLDVTAHAEILAITAASAYLGSKFLDSCNLYVTVEPCVMCAGAIFWARFNNVYMGCEDPKRGYSNFADLNFHPKTKVHLGVLQNECSALMTEFFAKLR